MSQPIKEIITFILHKYEPPTLIGDRERLELQISITYIDTLNSRSRKFQRLRCFQKYFHALTPVSTLCDFALTPDGCFRTTSICHHFTLNRHKHLTKYNTQDLMLLS